MYVTYKTGMGWGRGGWMSGRNGRETIMPDESGQDDGRASLLHAGRQTLCARPFATSQRDHVVRMYILIGRFAGRFVRARTATAGGARTFFVVT